MAWLLLGGSALSYLAVVDSCSCSHDVLHSLRSCMQLFVQAAERVRRGRSTHLPTHALCSRSHWLQQSLSEDFRVEQLKVKTLSKTIKTSKPHRFLFNLRSFRFGHCLPEQTHWLRSPLIFWLLVCHTLLHTTRFEILLQYIVLIPPESIIKISGMYVE